MRVIQFIKSLFSRNYNQFMVSSPAMITTLFYLAMGALILSACAGQENKLPPTSPTSEPTANQVSFGEVFRLAGGDKITISDTDITIQFLEVSHDNRCPTNVECIVAGWVTARIFVVQKDQSNEFELTIGDSGEEHVNEYREKEFFLILREVLPYPAEPVSIAPDNYTIELIAMLVEN